MATRKQRQNLSYALTSPLLDVFPSPIVAQRAPTTRDLAQIASTWIDQPNDDAYILTRVVANSATWINTGGGSGIFSAITVNPGNVTVTAGDIDVTAGNVTLAAGDLEVTAGSATIGAFGAGAVLSSGAGLLSSSAGTDGQLLIGSTGVAPGWAAITSATLVITPGAGTLNIEESGGTANSYVTDVGGPVAPLVGVLNLLGGTNMTTDGSVANTVTIDLDDNITLVGSVTAGVDFTMTSGDCLITGTTDAAQTIYIRANGGTSETIDIHSDQGTGQNSVHIHSDSGGVLLDGGMAAADAINLNASNAAGGIDIDSGTAGIIADTTGAISLDSAAASNFTVTGAFDLTLDTTLGSLNLTAGEAAVDAIVIDASDAAGGIDVDCGTGGLSMTATNGPINLITGTGDLNVGVDATVHDVTIGSITGASSVLVQGGTDGVLVTSTDEILLDSAGVLELNSSAGNISVGNDAVVQTLNLNTGAAVKTTVLGSTNTTSITTVQSGTGNTVITSGDDILIDSVGDTEINSSAGNVSICNDAVAQNVSIATGAAAQVLTLGNTNTTSSVVVDCGTTGATFGASATAHPTTLGSTNTTSTTTVQSGSGGTSVTSTGAIDLDATGIVSINSTGGVLNLGDDADSNNISIGTGGTRTVTVGGTTGASQVDIACGTGGVNVGISANAHTTTVGSTNTTSDTVIQAGSGGISLSAAGAVDMVPVTNSVAGVALTVNGRVTVSTFTGQTTASGAQETFTITNSSISATSAIFVTVNNVGANDARMTLEQVKPAAGSVEIKTQNNGGANLNGDVIITMWVIN